MIDWFTYFLAYTLGSANYQLQLELKHRKYFQQKWQLSELGYNADVRRCGKAALHFYKPQPSLLA